MTRPIYREQCHACGKTTKHYGTVSEFWDGLCEPCSQALRGVKKHTMSQNLKHIAKYIANYNPTQ